MPRAVEGGLGTESPSRGTAEFSVSQGPFPQTRGPAAPEPQTEGIPNLCTPPTALGHSLYFPPRKSGCPCVREEGGKAGMRAVTPRFWQV